MKKTALVQVPPYEVSFEVGVEILKPEVASA